MPTSLQSCNFCKLNETEKFFFLTLSICMFSDYETDVKSFEITGHQWYDYVLCGHKVIK